MSAAMDTSLARGAFSFAAMKDGKVFISRGGKTVVVLRGVAATLFLTKAEQADSEGLQLLMARATGNFKRGNERRESRA